MEFDQPVCAGWACARRLWHAGRKRDAGNQARLDRFIGYYEPYATSHDTLDEDLAMQEETRNVARAVATAVAEARAGRLTPPDAKLRRPRPK